MTTNLIIGNIISFIASCMLLISCLMKEPRRVYAVQTAENLVLCVASFFLGSWTGITTLLLAAVRNALCCYEQYTARRMAVICALQVVLGVWINNRGLVGLMPVIATLIYTVGCYLVKDILSLKTLLFVNVSMWAVYAFLIRDLSSGCTETVIAAVTLATIIRILRAPKDASR